MEKYIDKIKELEKKSFRIGFYPTFEKNKHEWTVCVRIGDDKRLIFIQGEPGCYNSSFNTKEAALEAIIKFCEEYKPKKTRTEITVPMKKSKK